jgi:DNA-binding transcriptional MocR family regulator
MTPTHEATFIALWQQGASYRELAAALGCPLGTVASRAAALVAQGKIQSRPRVTPMRAGAPRPSRGTHPHLRGHPRPHPRSHQSPPATHPRLPSWRCQKYGN